MARRSAMAEASATDVERPAPRSADPGDLGDEVTRCICGNEEFVSTPRTRAANANPGLFVQCETCHVWQHGFCVGFLSDDDIPDEYFCEQCEPSFHNISMRYGMLISRYRPVKPPAKPRSPRKARSRDTRADRSSAAKPGASDGSSTPSINGSVVLNPPAEAAAADAPSSGGSVPKQANGPSRKRASAADAPAPEELNIKASASPPDHPSRSSDLATPPSEGLVPDPGSPKPSRYPSEEAQPANGSDSRTQIKTEGNGDPEAARSKRSKRRASDDVSAGALASGRNGRLRRSREEEILQRVLEESAREARELEARRRGRDSDPEEASHGPGENEKPPQKSRSPSNGTASSNDENQQPPKPANPARSRRQRRAGGKDIVDTKEDAGIDTAEASKDLSSTKTGRPARSARARPGRKPAPKSQPSAAQRPGLVEKSQASAASRRTPNGVKKCRPRIPSPRSTFQEMRRRVANIIEFSSRTQVEMVEEKHSRSEGPFEAAAQGEDFRTQLAHLSALGERNMATLEQLTRKLLDWEEQFGPK